MIAKHFRGSDSALCVGRGVRGASTQPMLGSPLQDRNGAANPHSPRSPSSPRAPLLAGSSPLDAVAVALERHLEEERRERREQVGFLSRAHTQERELLVARAEAIERQFSEAREIWESERLLLSERISRLQTDGAAASIEQGVKHEVAISAAVRRGELSAREQHDAETCRLESSLEQWARSSETWSQRACEFEAEANVAQVQASESTAQAQVAERSSQVLCAKLAAVESHLADAEDREETVLRQHRLEMAAAESREVKAKSEANVERVLRERVGATHADEVQRLKAEILELRQESAQSRHDAEALRQREVAGADRRLAHVREEYESEGRESMLRALGQLQAADECLHSLWKEKERFLEEGVSYRHEIGELQRRVAEETETVQRLNALVTARDTQQRADSVERQALASRVRLLEEELRSAGPKSAEQSFLAPEAFSDADWKERREALAIAQRHLGGSASPSPAVTNTSYSPASPLTAVTPSSPVHPLARSHPASTNGCLTEVGMPEAALASSPVPRDSQTLVEADGKRPDQLVPPSPWPAVSLSACATPTGVVGLSLASPSPCSPRRLHWSGSTSGAGNR